VPASVIGALRPGTRAAQQHDTDGDQQQRGHIPGNVVGDNINVIADLVQTQHLMGGDAVEQLKYRMFGGIKRLLRKGNWTAKEPVKSMVTVRVNQRNRVNPPLVRP
jgi:hypothetical protein